MTDRVVGAETCCGCSVPLHSCEQSSKDLKVCVLTGRNLGPSPQYFARGNHFHSSATYRKKSVTMVPETREKNKTYELKDLIPWRLTDWKKAVCQLAVCTVCSILPLIITSKCWVILKKECYQMLKQHWTKRNQGAQTYIANQSVFNYRIWLLLGAPSLLLFHALAAALTYPQRHLSQQGLRQRWDCVSKLTPRRLPQ